MISRRNARKLNKKLTIMNLNWFKLSFLLFILSFIACKSYSKKGIEVAVFNHSSSVIVDVVVGTSEKLSTIVFEEVQKDENKSSRLVMEHNNTDGSYTISFKRLNGRKENITVGYYTNGGSLDRKMTIAVQNDTTLVTFSGVVY